MTTHTPRLRRSRQDFNPRTQRRRALIRLLGRRLGLQTEECNFVRPNSMGPHLPGTPTRTLVVRLKQA